MSALLAYDELSHNDKFICFVNDYIAFDPETRAYLQCSNSRRRCGRINHIYWMKMRYGKARKILARNDDEALAKAREIIGDMNCE